MNFRSLSKTTNQTIWRHKTNFDYLIVASLVALVIFVFAAQGVASAQGPPDQVVSEHALGNSPFAEQLSGEEQVTVTGILNILIEDDFANKRSKALYFLKDARTKESYKLRFAKQPSGHLRSGATVKAHGRAKGRDLYLALDESGEESIETVLPAQVVVAGEQKTLVIAANFLDASLSCSVPSIEDLMFTDPADNSVDDLYTETSFGEIWLTGQVVGPYTIDFTKDVCNVEVWANAADAAAQADGVDTGAYSRKLYVLPPSACPGAGFGTVGGNPSRAWIFTCDLADVFAHELGHNLGMGHAATPSYTYGDTSDVMGLGGGPLRQINAPHKEQMGWLPPELVAEVTENGVYHIAPLELDPFEAPAPQALKIFKPDTNEYYYLSYRRAIGFDANLSDSRYLDHLSVHRYIGNGSGSRTYALDCLADGESFVDTVNGITITQISHSDAYVTVQVQMDASCVTAAPIANISPANQSAAPGSTLNYTVTVSNADSANCAASTFSLAAVLPDGWTGTVSPDTIYLPAGQSTAATLSATSTSTAAETSYGLTVTVTDAAEPAHTTTAGASYVVELACSPGTPIVKISPANRSAAAGTTLDYSVTVSNTDSTACTPSSFSLSAALPGGWTGNVSPVTMTLPPGQSGTATLPVTSPDGATEASYGFTVTITDTAEPAHTASAGASYVVEVACNPDRPIAGISPVTQSAAPGTTLDYKITVNNTDSANCASSTFSLSASLPAGWTDSISPDTLTLSPGQSATATLSVTSPNGAAGASYGFTVNVSDASKSVHSASTGAGYVVEGITEGDTEAPTVPGGLKAGLKGKNVKLTWNPATDNVGVIGYTVRRDGTHIGDTADTGYVDSSVPSGMTCVYTVSAYDAAGNPSEPSSAVKVTTRGDSKGGGSKGGGKGKPK